MVSAAIRRRKMDAAAAPTGDFWAVVCHGRLASLASRVASRLVRLVRRVAGGRWLVVRKKNINSSEENRP